MAGTPMLGILKRKWLLLFLVVLALFVVNRIWSRGPVIQPGSFLLVELEGEYTEGPPQPLLERLFEEHKSFFELMGSLRKAVADQRVAGVIVRVGPIDAGWAQARDIRDALKAVRDGGKRVIAFIDNEGAAANLGYYIASVANSVYLPPGAATMLNGLSAHFLFLGGLWEKMDVAMEVQQIREYKTFGDMVSRREMSPAHREMANWLLDDLNDEFVNAIAEGRRIAVPEVLSTIDTCPAAATEYVEAGLADRVAFFDEMLTEVGGGTRAHVVREEEYHRVPAEPLGLSGGGKIALIHAVGNIVGGDDPRRGVMGGAVGSRSLARAFRQAAEDPSIKAVVFRIDSPGGSASASDQVWHAARATREKKPVIASLGNVAASGGYYMAAGADKIVAEPGTLTGSIGVVLLKPNVSGLLARFGIGSDALGRGRYSRVLDLTKPLDKAELALVKTQMEGVYRRFLDRVAEGRKMTVEEVDAIGGGRVWTGRQAKQRGLVDEIGGLQVAIRLAAEQGGIENPDRATVVHLPKPQNTIARLLASYRVDAAAAMPDVISDTLAPVLDVYSNLEPGVQTLTGNIVEIR
jgi:protease IV